MNRGPTQPKGVKEKEGAGHGEGQAGQEGWELAGAEKHHEGEGEVDCQGTKEDLLEPGEGS